MNYTDKSNCCNAQAKVYTGSEGTNSWECTNCGKACDLRELNQSEDVLDMVGDTKTVERVLRHHIAAAYLDGEVETGVSEALQSIQEIIERDVIGENKMSEHKEWDCPCGITHNMTEEWRTENDLRNKQCQALQTALYGKDKK